MSDIVERNRANNSFAQIAAERPLPLPQYFDTPGAAAWLGCSPRTLETMRSTGGGPRYCRVGGRAVRYRSDWLTAWTEQNAVASTSEETARRRA